MITRARQLDADAIVIGGGPAGAATAIALARRGRRVTLLDRDEHPRPKVCGGCLSAAGVRIVGELFGPDVLADLGAPTVVTLRLHVDRACAEVPLAPGRAIERGAFDHALLQRAAEQGVDVQTANPALAFTEHDDHVRVRTDRGEKTARIAVLADGLGGPISRQYAEPVIGRQAWVGLGGVLEDPDAASRLTNGVIEMHARRGGYVGAVRLDDQRLDVAAAVDPALIRDAGGPRAALAALVGDHGARLGADRLITRGTPSLTRRARRRAGRRWLVVGDAAGYVEPFTGEGMTWAMVAGGASARCIDEAMLDVRPDLSQRWPREYRRLLRARHRACGVVRWSLRRPLVLNGAVRAAAFAPTVGRVAASWLHRPWPSPAGGLVHA